MKVRFGYTEAMVIFAGAVSFVNFNLCITGLVLATLSAIIRGSLEYNEKAQAQEEIASGAKILTDALSSVMKPKHDDRKLH